MSDTPITYTINIPEFFRSNKEAIETTIALCAFNVAGLRQSETLEARQQIPLFLTLLDLLGKVYVTSTGETFQQLTASVEQQIALWKSMSGAEVRA